MIAFGEEKRLTPSARTAMRNALIGNFLWINISETARYFFVVRPMLHDAFPEASHVAAVTPGIFAIWVVWDTVLILAATGFFWLYLTCFGPTIRNAAIAATWITVTLFGLLWLGVANMGLAPITLLWAVLPLAWVEQMVAALIVRWAMRAD
jgi:hypothetical protein